MFCRVCGWVMPDPDSVPVRTLLTDHYLDEHRDRDWRAVGFTAVDLPPEELEAMLTRVVKAGR